MTVRHECSGKVWGTSWSGTNRNYQCSRNATVEHGGKWYCWQHDPIRVEAEAKKRRAGRRNAKLAALVTSELPALLEQLATHVPYTLHTGIGIATQARALATRIREALALEVNDES